MAKCIVKTCPNDSDDGDFVGPICEPCAEAIRGGGSWPAGFRVIASVISGPWAGVFVPPPNTGDQAKMEE